MKRYDIGDSQLGISRDEPPAVAHSGATDQHISCGSDVTESWYADVQDEIANAIEGASTTLDGTDRFQLLQAIRDLADEQIALVAPTGPILHVTELLIVNRTTVTGGFLTLPIGTIPAGRTSAIIEVRMKDIRGDEQHAIQIRDSSLRIYEPANNESSCVGCFVTQNRAFIEVSGASVVAYNVLQTQGAPTFNNFEAKIKLVGWL